jgi:hypothetical protein
MQATAAKMIASFFIISSFSVVPGFPGWALNLMRIIAISALLRSGVPVDGRSL